MEKKNEIKIPRNKIKEFILVYPPIKQTNDLFDSKIYLSLFAKPAKKSSLIKLSDINELIKNYKNNNNKSFTNNEIEIKKLLNKKENTKKSDIYYLIDKDIELKKNKFKRTSDIKHALEIFLRHSDLIEKITKFFEEFRENSIKVKISKMKYKKDKKIDNTKTEEENEKFIETYIESIISKLVDNVLFEKYKKNEFIVKMNDIGDNCYFLLSGKLCVLKLVEYHIELTYDDYMQYISNLLKNNEFELIENIRHINQNFIDLGLAEDLKDFIKSYFIIKLNKDINYLFDNNKFDISFIKKRFELFNYSFENFGLSIDKINEHIDEINKGSLLKEKDLREYFNKITMPKKEDFTRLETNPNIFDEKYYKVTIYKYEEFLYLKPGSFFGETALDSTVHKRNASIRTEEDCIILSLKNEIYKALLSETNKKLKSFDVIFICKNFFFNDISPVIFNRRYFSLFKLIYKTKDDIIYSQSDKLSSVYFIKEGNVKLEIYASIFQIYALIKKYFDILTHNTDLKFNQKEINEIKTNYFIDNNMTDIRHQSHIFKEQLKIKRKFEIYSSNLFDTLGLEEFFLNDDYLCTCTVISNEAKIFELNNDSLNIIISNEKQTHNAFYQLIGHKLISLIKRLNTIKIYYINQLNYKIKENFFGTEVPKDFLIKGQNGDKIPFSKYYKKKSESKIIKSYTNKFENEEIKNDFLQMNKANLKYHTRNNKFWNPDLNTINIKKNENLTYDNFKNHFKKSNKNLKIKLSPNKNSKKILDKNNILNSDNLNTKTNNIKSSSQIKNITEYSADINKDNDRTKRIMEMTIIKVGKDHLSLKEIGDRVKNFSKSNNSDLSIVRNLYYKTYSNIKNNAFINDLSDKKGNQINKTQNNYSISNNKNLRNINSNKIEPFSLKKNIMSLTSKNKNLYNNQLPRIPINTYSNFNNLLYKSNIYYYSKYNSKNKIKTNLFKSANNIYKRYNKKNNYKTFFDANKNSFNVVLTNDNSKKEKSNSKTKYN